MCQAVSECGRLDRAERQRQLGSIGDSIHQHARLGTTAECRDGSRGILIVGSVAGSFRYDAVILWCAANVVVGVDSSKLQEGAPVVALRWSEIDLLVTELAPEHSRFDPVRSSVTIL